MKTRHFLILSLFFLILIGVVCYFIATMGVREVTPYPTEINRLAIALGRNWDENCQNKERLIESDQPFDYAVIDDDGQLLLYTGKHISTSVSAAS